MGARVESGYGVSRSNSVPPPPLRGTEWSDSPICSFFNASIYSLEPAFFPRGSFKELFDLRQWIRGAKVEDFVFQRKVRAKFLQYRSFLPYVSPSKPESCMTGMLNGIHLNGLLQHIRILNRYRSEFRFQSRSLSKCIIFFHKRPAFIFLLDDKAIHPPYLFA